VIDILPICAEVTVTVKENGVSSVGGIKSLLNELIGQLSCMVLDYLSAAT